MRRSAVGLAIALSLPRAAFAQDAGLERAQALFNIGAQAYAQGQYQGAIEAFEAAYRASPRPGILFSLAQAHKKQFYASRSPADLRAATAHYREYLAEVSSGKYRVMAVEALAELEGIAAKTGIEDSTAPASPADKSRTRVMVSSAVEGAKVALDGGAPQPSPLIADVTPGKHSVRVEADGYFADTHPLVALEGGLVALDVPLRARPAKLFIRAESGADVLVDRRPVARTPLTAPIEIEAGPHFVALTRNGRRPYGEAIKLGRGESRTIEVALGATPQRTISYVLLGAAAVGAAAGAAFVGVAFYEQGQAKSVLAESASHNITQAQLDSYAAATDARDGFKRAAYGTFGGAAAFALGGAALFVFDTPRAPSGPGTREQGPARSGPSRSPLEVSAIPLAAPGLLGAGLVGRF